MNENIVNLPGVEFIIQGLEDLQHGKMQTIPALLVSIAATRLRNLGLDVPQDQMLEKDPELKLYQILIEQEEDPYNRYNSLIQRLISFSFALENRIQQQKLNAKSAF